MGYRQYILKVKKENAELIRNFDLTELNNHFKEIIDKEGFLPIHEILEKMYVSQVYELGKYFDDETLLNMTSNLFFKNKEVARDFEDYDVRILKDDGFLTIAKHYADNVKLYFDLLLTEPVMCDDYAVAPTKANPINKVDDILKNEYITKRIVGDLLSRRRNWNANLVMNIDKADEMLNNSWLYEYAVFDMLRLHKTADFDNYYYIIYGY